MLVLEDVLEVDNLAGVVAHGEDGDLVEDLGRAVDAVADAGAELGGVLHAGVAVGALADGGEQAAGRKGRGRFFSLFVYEIDRNIMHCVL